jgi:hypothetical protein
VLIERLFSQELTKLIRRDDRRSYLRTLGNSQGSLEQVPCWHKVRRPDMTVTIAPIQSINQDTKPRSFYYKNHLTINSKHVDFVLRCEPYNAVDARRVSYISLIAAGEYVADRDKGEHVEDRASRVTDVACQLEEAISRRLDSLKMRERQNVVRRLSQHLG